MRLRRRGFSGFKNKKYTTFNKNFAEYVNCGNGQQYDHNEPFTFIAIFKTTDTDGTIISKSDGGTTYKGHQAYIYNGYIYYRIYENGTSTGLKVHTNNTFNDGDYHLLVITYDGSGDANNVNIYIDNVSQAKIIDVNAGFSGTILNTAEINIGRSSYGSLYFTGIIDEVAYCNKVLSILEITKIYGNQSGSFNPVKIGDIKKIVGDSLDALWHLGDKGVFDGSNWTFPDQSGNGNDGVSQGMSEANVEEY